MVYFEESNGLLSLPFDRRFFLKLVVSPKPTKTKLSFLFRRGYYCGVEVAVKMVEEEKEKVEEGVEEEDRLGDPSRAPGADSERRLDPDLLLPFSLGWVRECITRQVKNGPQQVSRHRRFGLVLLT